MVVQYKRFHYTLGSQVTVIILEHTMLGEKDQIIIITVLAIVSFTLFLLVIFLSCVVCYQRRIGKMCRNCKEGHTVLSPDSNSRDPKPTSTSDLSPNPDPSPLPYTRSVVPVKNPSIPYPHPHMTLNHPLFTTNCTIIPFPLSSAPGQSPNRVSVIFLLVGYMYWNAEASDTVATLLSSLQHILIRVLEEPEVISNDDAMTCVKRLHNEIMGFAVKWREQRCRGWFSHQTTISSNDFIDKNSYHIELVDDTAERMKKSSNERVKFQQNKSKGGTNCVNELSKENGNQNMRRKTKERDLFTEPQHVTKTCARSILKRQVNISEDDKDRPIDCLSQEIGEVTIEDLEIEDETDGGGVHEVEDTIKTMKHLVSVLTRWISAHDNVDEPDQVKT